MHTPTPLPHSELLRGTCDTLPLIVGAILFGIIFGVPATAAGLSPMATMGMSLFVSADSPQFVTTGLLTQGTGIAPIVLTTFIVNFRQTLYSARDNR